MRLALLLLLLVSVEADGWERARTIESSLLGAVAAGDRDWYSLVGANTDDRYVLAPSSGTKQPILSATPYATPITAPEKGSYGGGVSQPIPLWNKTGGEALSPISEDADEIDEITTACFKISADVEMFCVEGSDPQWGAEALAVGMCESGLRSEAVGAAGELGALQVHPIHFPGMLKTGLNPYYEPDRFLYGYRMWERSGWRPWSCGYRAEGAVVAKGGLCCRSDKVRLVLQQMPKGE